MNRLHYNRLWSLLGILGLALILTLSILPPSGGEAFVKINDKLAHFIAYFFAAFYYKQIGNKILSVFLSLLIFGGAIEILQFFSVYRSAEWLDLLANILGILSGCISAKFLIPNFFRNLDTWIKEKIDY